MARPDLVLVLAAPFHVGALGQRHRVRNHTPSLIDEAADVPAAHIQEHGDDQQTVLARDHRRS